VLRCHNARRILPRQVHGHSECKHARTVLVQFVVLTVLQQPPLYLHITSTTKEGLEKAIQKINELMQQELPNLVDERRFRRREPDQVQRDEHGRVLPNAILIDCVSD
jgi:predicted metallo-beta-lactamase superfamily hydrolase